METPILLPADVDGLPEIIDHPDAITEAEAREGHALWLAIDDLDDTSNGLERPVGLSLSGRASAMSRARVMREILLDYGVPEVSIELVEGRPTFGEDTWNACKPVALLSHHIASRPTPTNPTPGLSLVTKGRSDLPGPLCNGTAGVDLVYRIKCMGWANHPGVGGPWTVHGPCGAYTIPEDVGRPYLWGTEYEGGFDNATWDRMYTNKRTGDEMTFREFMGRANAGLAHAIWLINGHGRHPSREDDLSGYHGEHKTWAPGRKPDRLDYTTESGRAELRRYQQEDDMPTPEELWNFPIDPVGGAPDDPAIPAKRMLAQAHNRAKGARESARAAEKAAEHALTLAQKNRDALKALAASLTPEAGNAVRAALGQDDE